MGPPEQNFSKESIPDRDRVYIYTSKMPQLNLAWAFNVVPSSRRLMACGEKKHRSHRGPPVATPVSQ
jgi:hypothetical protein